MSDSAGPLFDSRKAPGALRTIGEVAQAVGIRQHVLRYWEEQFPMLRPLKRSGGRRYYRAEDVALVERIDRLVHREGYTLKGAKAVLAGTDRKDSAAPAPLAGLAAATGSGIPAELLMAIRNRLAAALEKSI